MPVTKAPADLRLLKGRSRPRRRTVEEIGRIVDMRRRGLTLNEIGLELGISRGRVSQILDRAGMTRRRANLGARPARTTHVGAERRPGWGPRSEVRWRGGTCKCSRCIKRRGIEDRLRVAQQSGTGVYRILAVPSWALVLDALATYGGTTDAGHEGSR